MVKRPVAHARGSVFNAIEAPGDYELRVALHDTDGKSYGQISKTLTVPDAAKWMNNTLGENAGVLPPWTPLQVKKGANGSFSVLCWGREYQFGTSAWPTQIVSKSENLLGAPIELQILSGGKETPWENVSAKIVSQSPEAAEIEGRAQAVATLGVLLTTKMRLEFDGMMLVSFNLQAPQNFKPKIVRLDIALRDSNALYRHRWSAGARNVQKTFTGALDKSGGPVVNQSPYLPAAWLGDNKRGLFWFCESAEHWPNWKNETAFQILHGKIVDQAVVVQRFNLLNGQPLPQNWNYQFGLQATPVKPFPRDWRAPFSARDARQSGNLLAQWTARFDAAFRLRGGEKSRTFLKARARIARQRARRFAVFAAQWNGRGCAGMEMVSRDLGRASQRPAGASRQPDLGNVARFRDLEK